MRALDRKLLRDLWRMRLQAGAIALLIACGVAVTVMAFSAHDALVLAQGRYYAQTRFADVFATTKRAPRAVIEQLRRIDGVVAVDARAMKIGLMPAPGLLRPASAELIALPDDMRSALNRLVLIHGRLPDPERTDEAVALKTFLEAARVRLGERLSMVVDGRRMSFKIVGSVLSPEFIYSPAAASWLPDDAHQGVFWAPRPTAEKATGLGGAFSMVSLKLAARARVPAVLAEVDRILAPWGGAPAIARADHVSHKFVQDHITQFAIMAWVIPPVFLAVAAALVHMVIGRLVEAEREQIGLLKAFGYSDWRAASPYLKMAALIGLAGSIAGGATGAWLGAAITAQHAPYMRFPRLDPQIAWPAFAVSAAVSMAAAAAGSLLAVRRAARLSPAVAMRPLTPTSFRRGIVERLPVWRWLDQPTRIIVRNLERFPMRAALTLLGLAVSLTLLTGSQFVFGSLDEIIDQTYFRSRRWTDVVGFAEGRDVGAVLEASRLPGVLAAEPVRYAGVRVHAHGREVKAYVSAPETDARFTRVLDAADRRVALPGQGAVLSGSLANRLGVKAGDQVEVEVTEGRRPHAVLRVTSLARDYAGFSMFMSRQALNRLTGDGDLASTADLLVAADRRRDFYRAVVGAPQIFLAISRADTVSSFRTQVTGMMRSQMAFYLAFAGAIAFGVAYNVSRIALSDRARDLATLRTLGFDRKSCAYILLGELLFLSLLATPLGALGGAALAWTLVAAFSQQEMQLPFVMTAHNFGVAFSAYFAAVLVAAALVGRRVWSLDLVAALKTRE